jgi:nitrogen fixation/metabolism regulation signal transduction histidine kinase
MKPVGVGVQKELTAEEILHLTSLREIFNGFTHEIAQPLHTIMIASQVLQLKISRTNFVETDRDFLTQRLDIVVNQVQRATQIIESMRRFARGEQHDGYPINARELLNRVQTLMGQQFAGRGIDLVIESEEGLPNLGGNPAIVEDVMVHCLAFARDTIAALEFWYKQNAETYAKCLQITIGQLDTTVMKIEWNGHNGTAIDGIPDPEDRIGLTAARSILAQIGGHLEIAPPRLVIRFPDTQ